MSMDTLYIDGDLAIDRATVRRVGSVWAGNDALGTAWCWDDTGVLLGILAAVLDDQNDLRPFVPEIPMDCLAGGEPDYGDPDHGHDECIAAQTMTMAEYRDWLGY